MMRITNTIYKSVEYVGALGVLSSFTVNYTNGNYSQDSQIFQWYPKSETSSLVSVNLGVQTTSFSKFRLFSILS